MHAQSVYKIPQGKLLKISLEYNKKKNTIISITITGDFFIYPEESIEQLEETLRNTEFEREQLREKIQKTMELHHMQCIGIHAEGLTQGIMMCKV